MNFQNGCTLNEAEKSRSHFFSLLSKKSTGIIYKTLFDYIASVAKELKESQSFYTFDMAEVLWRIELWKKKMPHVRPFFAVKTNSDPVFLRLLALLGFSFDCATEGEIRFVLEAGGDPKNIIFAHVIKTPAALQYAASVGVELMTFDCKEELLKIKKYYPEARLLLRIVPEDVECSYDLRDKFGCEIEEAEEILSFAKTLGLNVIGVSFHVGGLCKNPNSYAATILASQRVFNTAKELGFQFTMLDIGGGFLGDNRSEGLFHKISAAIQSALEENFSDLDIEIIAEPGTYFACSAVTLTTAICGKKKRNEQCNIKNEFDSSSVSVESSCKSLTTLRKNPVRRFYYVNDSIYGSFYDGVELYGCALKPLLSDEERQRRPSYNSNVWGQTCCGEDLLAKEQQLPDLEEGEFIVWENMGAYNQVLCTAFCGVPYPASRYVFINNPRLSLEWLSNAEELVDFLRETCSLIEKE